MNDLVITAVDQAINDAHSRVLVLGKATEERLLSLANAIVECGSLLLERQKNVKHGHWSEMFATHKGRSSSIATFAFDYSTGCRYMRVAGKHPSAFTNWQEAHPYLKEVGIVSGQLESTERDRQNSRNSDFGSFLINECGRWETGWSRNNGDEYLLGLSAPAKEQLEAQLLPVKQRIDRALEILANRQEAA